MALALRQFKLPSCRKISPDMRRVAQAYSVRRDGVGEPEKK